MCKVVGENDTRARHRYHICIPTVCLILRYRLHVYVLTFMSREGGEAGGVTAERDGGRARNRCSRWRFQTLSTDHWIFF